MGRTRQFKKQKCFNPECINGGAAADLENKKCFWEKDNLDKVFCSPECGQHYIDHEDEIKEKDRMDQNIRKEINRQEKKRADRQRKLIRYMFLSFNKKIAEAEIASVVNKFALASPYVK